MEEIGKREAQERIHEIQRIMERSTLYTTLPGVEAVIGGILALAGCVVSFVTIRSLDFAAVCNLTRSAQWAFWGMWSVVAGVAIVQSIVLTAKEIRKQGLTPLYKPGRLVALALTPSVLVAVALTFRIILDSPDGITYLAPIWMMCYGTGVYVAGLFSLRMPRILGIAFIATGALGLFFLPGLGVLLTALSFGIYHIVFGMLVVRRKEQAKLA